MPRNQSDVFVFSHIREQVGSRFVPAGILSLTEHVGASAQQRGLASAFAYGTKYLGRPQAFEIDPVSLGLQDREAIRGQRLFPVNGLQEFGGIRDAAPDAWGRRVIEAQLNVPANSLQEVQYLLHAGGDRVGALDIRAHLESADSASASDLHSLEYILEAAEAVESGTPVPARLAQFLGSGPSAGGARPKASVRDEHGALWLAKFPARGDAFDVARAETCTLELARRCGLTVPEVRYLSISGRPVMLIRRFDRYWASSEGAWPHTPLHETRPAPGNTEGRLPFVSGLTLVGCSEFESPDKEYADLGQAIRRYVHPDWIKANSEEMFARMVFNIFVTNDDDHLRNHGFVRDPRLRGWVLSPLYDVVPRPVIASERHLHLGIGRQGKLATLDNALSHHAALVASRPVAIRLMHRIWSEVRQWKTFFEEHGANARLIQQIEPAFRDLTEIATPTLEAEVRKSQPRS